MAVPASLEGILKISNVPMTAAATTRRPVHPGCGGGVVRLAAAPVDGAANGALVDFLADLLDCPKRAVAIVSGERSRDKRVRVSGAAAAGVEPTLSAILRQ